MSVTGTLSRLPQAATRGFHLNTIKTAATVVAGSFITSFLSGKAQSALPVLGSNRFVKVATTLLTAGLVGYAAKKVAPGRANELFAGGMISGVTEGLAEVFPNIKAIGTSGLEDFANPMNVGMPYQMHGLQDFMDPRQVGGAISARQPIAGLNEFVSIPAIAHAPGLMAGYTRYNDDINQPEGQEFLV